VLKKQYFLVIPKYFVTLHRKTEKAYTTTYYIINLKLTIMRKIYMMLTALLASFAITANAERVLYQETYEAGGVPTTWTANGKADKVKLSLASTDASTILQWTGGGDNGRSAHDFWGTSIYEGVDAEEYSLQFEIRFDALGNNQYNGEVAIFADPDKCIMTNGTAGGGNWDPYAAKTNCLFSLVQTNNADNKQVWKINNDEGKPFTPNVGATGTWYCVTLTVNTKTKEVAYEIFDYDQSKAVATGVKTMADDAKLYATGLYLMAARYWSVYSIDNLKVFLNIDYANKPVIALSALNLAERTFNISFLEGETLHVIGTDGVEQVKAYDDVEDGTFVYTTSTSGTIKAWTVAGAMKSEEATMDVVCEAITIPAPAMAIVSASEGYGKTYQFTIDNQAITLSPEVFMDFSFASADGTADFTLNDQNNGVKVEIPAKGKLTIKTKALGYESGSYTLMNDQEFEIKHDIDLQHITADELTEKGFEKMDDLNSATTSGENNWTGRKYLYYRIATGVKDDDGNDTYTNYTVYGPNGEIEGAVEGAESIQRYRYLQSKLNETTAHQLFAPMYVWYGTTGVDKSYYEEDGVTPKTDPAGNPGGTTNLQVKLGLGIVFSGQVNDAENYNPNSISYSPILINTTTMGVDGLTDNDFIVVSQITNYGSGSEHPIFPAGTDPAAARAEYKAMHLGGSSSVVKGTETFTLNRVDAALARVLVLTPKSGST
jgi:hypothetical protein